MTKRAVSGLMRLRVATTLIAAVLAAGLSLSGLAAPVAGASGTNASGTVITSSANPAAYQTAVTLTATVTGTSGLGAPTGTVAFTDGSHTALTCGAGSDSSLTPISSSASSATCLYTPPATGGVGGTFGTIGTYSGDSAYATSAGSLAQEVLGTLPTLGNNVFSANPSPNGAQVTMNDTLTDTSNTANPATAAGAFAATVTVLNQSTSAVLCANVAVSPTGTYTASWSCNFTPTGPGQTLITRAVYSGNDTFAPSSGSATLTVAGTASTTPSVVANPTTLALGASTTLTATLTGTPAPTGNVTFLDDGTPIPDCGRIVEQSGVAKSNCAYAPASVGSHSITVTYSGDINYAAAGPSAAATVITGTNTSPPSTPPSTPSPGSTSHGYWLVGSDGGIFSFGSAQFYGSMGGIALQRPVVGIVPTRDRGGYWLDASDGGVFSFGDTQFYGSIPGLGLNPAGSGKPHSLNAPIVGMVPSHDQGGYFMVASDGGVFAFGDAHFAGSCPGIGGCSGAAVAVMPDASGNGYWLVTSTGSVYTFGGAPSLGAPGPQSSPITSAVATPDGGGYYVLDAAGQVFSYGDALGLGSLQPGATGGLNPASAIFVTSDNGGYWVSDALGDVYTFGDAPNHGSMAGTHLNGSIIAASGS